MDIALKKSYNFVHCVLVCLFITLGCEKGNEAGKIWTIVLEAELNIKKVDNAGEGGIAEIARERYGRIV